MRSRPRLRHPDAQIRAPLARPVRLLLRPWLCRACRLRFPAAPEAFCSDECAASMTDFPHDET